MTLEEVRIGNYYCNWLGQTCLMTKERFIHFASADIYRIYTIHVSEEWISNFNLFNDFRFSDVGVDIRDQSKIHFFGSDLILPMPKYVHKLQNLVFELTGKELISKNTKDND